MFLAQLQEKAGKTKEKKRRRLHPSAAQQLVASQEADGHFDARTLAFKLARVWEKLLSAASMPDGANTDGSLCLYSAPAVEELSGDPIDATVFVVRLFEIYAEKSGSTPHPVQREKVAAWFGSGGILRDRWLVEAESWLASKRTDWRSARANAVKGVLEKWFDVDADCKHRGTFVDKTQLQARQAEIGEKFAAAQKESLCRGERWTHCTPANIESVQWKQAAAVGWCLGGEGGVYPVRFGSEKLMVKRCTDVGDLLAEQIAKMVGVRSAPVRFIAQTSPEYSDAEKALTAVEPDEPEIGRRLQWVMGEMRQTGHPLMVMEFVPGESLDGYMGSQVLRNGDAGENRGLMRALGRTIAFDCLMNNWDRFPALSMWPRKGNLDNVLISKRQTSGTHDLVFIDQAVILLTDAKDRLKYFHALRSFVEEVAAAGRLVADGKVIAESGMQRIKKAIHGQVVLWTGDKAKDAEMYERFMIKPDSVPGVYLGGDACRFLVEGISGVFSRAKALRENFAAKRMEWSALCHELFVEVDKERYAKFTTRLEACLDFVYACLGVVESDALYKVYTQQR